MKLYPPPHQSCARRHVKLVRPLRMVAVCVPWLLAVHAVAQTVDLEFINETGQSMRVDFELRYYISNPPDCTYSGSSGWYDGCAPANDEYTLQTDATRFIAQVNVSCTCSQSVVASIYCGDDPVVFQCGLMDWFIMGLAPQGWRVEPYTP